MTQPQRNSIASAITGELVAAIAPGSVTLQDIWDSSAERTLSCDAIVMATQRASDDALYREITGDPSQLAEAGISGVYAIGDCVAPSLIAESVFSGHRLAREIDTEDPATPLPFIRERRLLGASEQDYALPAAEHRTLPGKAPT
jgi:dimethylamine/trimethylamine dehydrogenase